MRLADTIEKIKDELNGLQDRTGIPIKLILDIVAFLLLPGKATAAKLGKLGLQIKGISDTVELTVKKGSNRFTTSQYSPDLFGEFTESHPSFPYSKNFKTITWYHNATMPHIIGTSNPSAGAITFGDRTYFHSRPLRTARDMAVMFHEFVHTFHYKKHGEVVFAAVYVGNYLWNLIKDKFDAVAAYGDIKFEKHAVDWENRFEDWLRNRDGFTENSGQSA